MRKRPHDYLRECANRYGDIYRIPLPLRDIVLVTRPDHVDHIMNTGSDRYSMVGPASPVVKRILGHNLLTLEGDPHREQRRQLAPMFGRRELTAIATQITDEMVARVDQWSQWADTGVVVDLQHEIAKVMLPVFLRAMYSTAMTEEEIDQIDVDIRVVMRFVADAGVVLFAPGVFPRRGEPSFFRAQARLRRTMGRLVSDRIANPREGTDWLDFMIGLRSADGSALTASELGSNLIALMGGGYDTTVAGVSWTLALLAADPESAAAAYAEIDTLAGATPGYDDLSRQPWLRACFDETQRMQSMLYNWRFALEDDEIDGYYIPKGTQIGVPVDTMHRDPRWWPEPDRFDPTRFTDPEASEGRPKLAFIPFGAGPHRCIGSALGYMNVQFLLTIILQRYRIATPPGWTPEQDWMFSTPLKGGLPVTITRV
jgi:cytochrome P450